MSIIFDPQQEFRIPHPRDAEAYFIATPLTHRERLALASMPQPTTVEEDARLSPEERAVRVSEQFEKVIAPLCRKKVHNWGGYLAPDGRPIPFRSEYLDRLELEVLQVICAAILAASTVTPEEAGELR